MRPNYSRHMIKQNPDRWLVSYADFITLLFAFFVVMYAVSNVSLEKYKLLAAGFTKTFSHRAIIYRPENPIGQVQNKSNANKINQLNVDNLADELSAMFRQARIYQNDDWVEVSLKVKSLFKPGSISVSPQGEKNLLSLGNLLKDKPGLLAVEGHADNLPVTSDSRYESNWSLSAARAASVAQVLAKAGVHADKIAVVGYADQFPVASNQTEAGRSKNRRVVIVIGKTKPGQRMLNPMASDPVREQREKTNYLNQTEETTILKEKKTSSGGVRFTRETIRVKKETTP